MQFFSRNYFFKNPLYCNTSLLLNIMSFNFLKFHVFYKRELCIGAKKMTTQVAIQKEEAHVFQENEYVVYPVHGVGKITAIEDRSFEGQIIKFVVIEIKEEKLVLRVPINNLSKLGIRPLFNPQTMAQIEDILRQRIRVRRMMWSRRAQEYESKINSGDPVAVAEVVRELYKRNDMDQSYSERQIYQQALSRLAREVGAIKGFDEAGAVQHLRGILDAA